MEHCIAKAKSNTDASSSAFDKPVCDCLDDLEVLQFTVDKCSAGGDDTTVALLDGFKDVFAPCGTPSDKCKQCSCCTVRGWGVVAGRGMREVGM